MTTQTRQATWEDLRQWVRTASDSEVSAAARALGVSVSGNADQRRRRLIGFIGDRSDLNETSTWTPPGWRAPEDVEPEPMRPQPAAAPRRPAVTPASGLSDTELEERNREIIAERATRRARENAQAQAEAELAEEEAARHQRRWYDWRPVDGLQGLVAFLAVAAVILLAVWFLSWSLPRLVDWVDSWNDGGTTVVTTGPTGDSQATATPATGNGQKAPVAPASDTGKMPSLPGDGSHGSWKISTTSDLDNTDPIVRDFMGRLPDPAPAMWPTFPNVPNPKLSASQFPVVNGSEVPWGAEYGVPNVPFCQQDQRCDFVVPARHYRLITADYSFQGMTCNGEGKKGCLLLLVNVGGETYTWRNQMADNGFSVPGRYWHGDHLDTAMWGLVSHASANMLNMPTMASPDKVLNAGGSTDTNGGANCGVPNACQSVDATIVVHAGDRILAVAKSTVTR